MFKIIAKTGESIIKYGDEGNVYYILAKGQCSITVYNEGTDPLHPDLESQVSIVKIIESDLEASPVKPMVGFGEIALLYNDKRTASVKATSDCSLWALDGDVFKKVIAQNSIARRNLSLENLHKVELFKSLDKY